MDPKDLLLPKKDAPSVDSAQRVNAGALLAQEQQAGTGGFTVEPAAEATNPPTPAPEPKKEQPFVTPLQTYKGDIERVVTDTNVSAVTIATAEAKRQAGQSGEGSTEAQAKTLTRKIGMVLGGILLLFSAAGAVYWVLMPRALPAPQTPVAPFISVDDVAGVLLEAGDTRERLMAKLQDARTNTDISLGLVRWVYIAQPGATPEDRPRLLSAMELFGIIARTMPETLLRTLTGPYIFGVHSFDENQSFFVLEADSYETAYRGMLDWERTMRGDLGVLFSRNPTPKVQTPPVETIPGTPAASAIADPNATSTPSATTTPQSVTDFIQTGFVDKVVENHDARVVLNAEGDILLLWTFLGRNRIVITTNEFTLREVISRMSTAPVVPTF